MLLSEVAQEVQSINNILIVFTENEMSSLISLKKTKQNII